MRWNSFPLLIAPLTLFADIVPQPEVNGPWLTGPLLAPSPLVVPGGHWNIEPYLYATANLGTYDENWRLQKNEEILWSNALQPVIQVGLTDWMDVQIYPTLYYNYTRGAGAWVFGDFPLQFDFQLYQTSVSSWAPNVKFTIREIFPTGEYDELKLAKKQTDLGGGGSYVTSFAVAFGDIYHVRGFHFLSWRLSLQYSFPAPVQLKGLNAYGGGEGTDLRYFPAQSAQVDLGVEWTLSQNWAFACDAVLNWAKGDAYSGVLGVVPDAAAPAPIGFGSPSFQYSLAPALEYNWSENLGLIFGSWFTVAGKNALGFCSAIGAVNYYF